MTTFTQLGDDEPDLAQRVLAILTSTTNAVLATIRVDGTPRVSGIDPFVFEHELWIGSMPGTRKATDLRRDPRMALHAIPWESRRLRDGATDPGEADAKVTGRAVPTDDPATVDRLLAWFKSERGFEPSESGDLFRIEVEELVVIAVDGDQLVIDRWTATSGRQVLRRS